MYRRTIPLKGAPGHIYNTIVRLLHNGQQEISYLDLALESDYSLAAVITAVHRLERDGLIILERRGSGRRNRYQLPTSVDIL